MRSGFGAPGRVLLATFGSLGDLHPFLAVGRALLDRGVAVRLAAAEDYRAAVEAEGLEFAPMRPSIAALGDPAALASRLFDPLRGAERLLRELVIPHVGEAHEDLQRAAQDADLLVSHTLTFALPMIAERHRKPWLSVALAPMAFISHDDPPTLAGIDLLRIARRRLGSWGLRIAVALMRRAIHRWERPLRDFRRQIGAPHTDALHLLEGQFSPQGTLALFDAPLAQPQADWPPRVTICGAPLHDGPPADSRVLGELQRFLDRGAPPLVFALGSSAVYVARDFWPAAIEASRQLGRRAILLTGQPLPFALPEGVIAFDYLRYSTVFPHAAAVIHQVGIGTLSQAMRAGRPQLLVPVSFDQPDNARRAAALGIARVLPFQRVSAARLARELRTLLDDRDVAARAEALARGLRDGDGARVAADRIVATLATARR